MPGLEVAEGYAHYLAMALAGCALTAAVARVLLWAPLRVRLAGAWRALAQVRTGPPAATGRAIAAHAAGLAVAGLALAAGPLVVYHATVAPILGMVDGASRVVCCFEPGAGVLASADGAWATRGHRLVDLRRGAVVPGDDGRSLALRARTAIRFHAGSAYFGDETAPSRVGVFSPEQPLSVHFGDGTKVGLSNPSGNCVVIADDGPIAAVVASHPQRSLLEALVPLRDAGTIDFVDLRTGRTLRSVTVARLDGFSCTRGPTGAATLVGTAGGARWVLSQERWIKVFDVRIPSRTPARELRRALALHDAT
ncbi:MAG TPA: hypothetical protein VFX05_08135 [Casimicrobiaceae bacterium]|nr:hypothetical protein [Casimicrobiaceae bacterium]